MRPAIDRRWKKEEEGECVKHSGVTYGGVTLVQDTVKAVTPHCCVVTVQENLQPSDNTLLCAYKVI